MSGQDAPGSKSLSGSVTSLDTSGSGPQERGGHSDVTPFSSPDKVATVKPMAAVGQSTELSPKAMLPLPIVLQNLMAQAQNPVMERSMVQNALGTSQRPVLQQSKTFTAPPADNPDAFHAVERRLQVFKCEILNEMQSSLNNYAPLALHKTSQDIAAASHNELKSLLESERQMRDVSIEAVQELHAGQMQDLTIYFQKEIEAVVERERKVRNTQFEELAKHFCTHSVYVEGKVDGDVFSQESHDDVLLQESKIVETQAVTSNSTTELIVEPTSDFDGDSAWQTETRSSQEKIKAAYSELEGAFLNLSKEFDTRLHILSEHMNEIQLSLNKYVPLALHKTSQDIAAASHNELRSLLESERQMRDVSIEAAQELHARQMQDLTINFQKEIEAAVERERKEHNTQFEELAKHFCTHSVCVDCKVDGDIFSQESYDDVFLQESKMVETQTTTSDSTTELIVESNIASDSLCESNRSINDLDNALHLLSMKYGPEVDGDSAWQTETESSQEKIMTAYSFFEGALLNLSKEFDTRFRLHAEHMMAETNECHIRLDEHHTWNAEIVRSYQELRAWVIDLKDSDYVESPTV